MEAETGQALTARSGSNLAAAFFCLPRETRQAMSVFYGFCRLVDDVADSSSLSLGQKQEGLAFWRAEIERAYRDVPRSPLGRELASVVRRYRIAREPLEEIVNGVEMDLRQSRYRTFAELEVYCRRVASAVGLVSIEIFGCRRPESRCYAEDLGMAFQLTNILRDVQKDAAVGRVYLPEEELAEFGLGVEDVLLGRWSEEMHDLCLFQYLRAKHYFARSHRWIHPEDQRRLVASEAMRAVYEAILEKIRKAEFRIFSGASRMGKFERAGRMAAALFAFSRQRRLSWNPPRRVMVLGAGFAGMAAAVEATLSGDRVALREARAQVGGRAGSFLEAKSGERLDTGQHLLMGCYRETLRLLRSLGAEKKLLWIDPLRIPFRGAAGESLLEAWPLPSPWHLLGAFLGYREISWKDRWAAIRLIGSLLFGRAPLPEETAERWLRRRKQPQGIVRALWEPLCLAACNQDLSRASARMLVAVIRRSLLGSRKDSALVFCRGDLGDLLAKECERLLRFCGGSLSCRSPVSRLLFSGGRLEAIEDACGERGEVDQAVSALPWNALRSLLPEGSALQKICRSIGEEPILNLYLWTDRPLTREIVVGFLDSPVHWLFCREEILGKAATRGHAYAVVISAAQSWKELSREAVADRVVEEIRQRLPGAAEVHLLHSFLYRAQGGTPSLSPEACAMRPGPRTEWRNFWIAGDWTNTGLPATIEGAVQSGISAVRAMNRADGEEKALPPVPSGEWGMAEARQERRGS
ncbi:hydroxysqualene dehydroxylase HpnE [Methylacidimicrobium tartarophylax]|uniref:All-trans-phytoene synthase n=1 Tax=Methylacidimicrobium tartarophylax TaxID=1041768 RepID=A0A5E6M7Q6_9BACT|nr:hydroxysqualene dehydroxylase HpnE [Methylacidimicrobium tartarophylax]VVM04417.1 All-trans-phytoene synthase [Methylacidimicrobium tartarophylax]